VQDYVNEQDKTRKAAKLCLLRNLGNHKHNTSVLKNGKGTFIVNHRPTGKVDPAEYGPCEQCFAYILLRDLWRHSCLMQSTSSDTSQRKSRAVSSKLLMPPPPGISEKFHRIIAGMKEDSITRIAKGDRLIVVFGEKLLSRHGHERHQYNYIRCKIREISRLLQHLRLDNDTENARLEDFMKACRYRDVVMSVRNVAGFDDDKHEYKVPSLALKLGHSLRKCTLICEGWAIESGDIAKRNEVKSFRKLLDINWTEDMSRHALRTLSKKKRNKPRLLPLANDVRLLSIELKKKGRQAIEELKTCGDKVKVVSAWSTLRNVVLTRLMLFNRRRQGEVSHLLLEDYAKIHCGSDDGFVMANLSFLEKELSRYFSRVEIIGKRGNTVPLLMDSETKEWLDTVVSKRPIVGVHPDNQYVFARACHGSEDHVRGCDTLRHYSAQCGAKEPQLLRSTYLRKQIATMSQILNLKEHELDLLARFLGHDIRTHREYYRLPEDTLQVAKVSKLLIAMERGGQGLQPGQQLDDIVINPNEGKCKLIHYNYLLIYMGRFHGQCPLKVTV